jgi:hypothetical protein
MWLKREVQPGQEKVFHTFQIWGCPIGLPRRAATPSVPGRPTATRDRNGSAGPVIAAPTVVKEGRSPRTRDLYLS